MLDVRRTVERWGLIHELVDDAIVALATAAGVPTHGIRLKLTLNYVSAASDDRRSWYTHSDGGRAPNPRTVRCPLRSGSRGVNRAPMMCFPLARRSIRPEVSFRRLT